MVPINLSPNHRLSYVLCRLVVVVLFSSLFLFPHNISAQTSPALASFEQGQEPQYKIAKDYYYKLERDPAIGKKRSNWLKGVRNFRRIYLIQTKGAHAPSSLYMMARMNRRMYQRFQVAIDLEESISYFKDVASLFPHNTLADDALFNVAEILRIDKEQNEPAADLYLKIIRNYPQGDRYAQAMNRLQDLKDTLQLDLSDSIGTSNSQPELVNVLPVNYWSSDDYTRVVIRASAPVNFSTSLLEKNVKQPRRLYIDFAQSYIPPKFRSPVPIEDGLLKQVRTGQFNDNTVRVVLDIESISNYKVFSLKDPFRVVVDVHGSKPGQPSAPASSDSNTPRYKRRRLEKSNESPPERNTSFHFVSLRDYKKTKVEETNETLERSSGNFSLAQQLGLQVRKIVIDPGHGGRDPGAMAFNLKEKNIVLEVSRKVAQILHNEHGYEVALTRSTDVFLPLEERTAIANTHNADLFLSVHVNAHPDKTIGGVETYYLNLATNAEAMRVAAVENATSTHNMSELQDILADLMQNSKINESSRLAQYVHANLINGLKSYKIDDLGVKQAPFYVLLGAEMPAILAEISFITNPQEAKLLQDDSYLTKIAQTIAKGMVTYIDQNKTAALGIYPQ